MSSDKKKKVSITQHTLIWEFQDTPNTDPNSLAEQFTEVHIASNEPSPEFSSLEPTEVLFDRYEIIGLLGQGGMGEVLRVFDRKFQRTMALKIIHHNLVENPLISQLFIKEAQSTGKLQHPGTVPVHDFGTLEDGRFFFTMQEIHGITLKEAIRQVHHPKSPKYWSELRGIWSIQRLLNAFLRICENLSYAHHLGIMHRDIKPDNFMLGEHGEVFVMDWGIAKILPHGVEHFPYSNLIRPNVGSVVGTPEYIAPEQAQGESDQVTARSDVFSLGCVLYEIITGEQVRERTGQDIKNMTTAPCAALPISDPELQDIYQRCIALDPHERYVDSGALEQDFERWLDGESKRQQALAWVQKSRENHRSVQQMRQQLQRLEAQAMSLQNEVNSWDPIDKKEGLWLLVDEINSLKLKAELTEMNSIESLQSALHYAPHLDLAHRELARIYFDQHQQARLNHNSNQQRITLELMKIHDRGEFESYLTGKGTVSINSDSNEQITLLQFIESRRRLTPSIHSTHQTPCTIELPVGSYAIKRSQGQVIPIYLVRDIPHLDVVLEPETPTSSEEVFIHSGHAWVGDPSEPDHSYRRVFIDSFTIQKHPITNRQYILFLNDLKEQGREMDAWKFTPQARSVSTSDYRSLSIYDWCDENKSFIVKPDSDGDKWELDWPVILISAECAIAYATWYSKTTKQNWKLPTPLQWEKAARGVDGRSLPWGNHFEPTWAAIRGHTDSRALPAEIGIHKMDCSVYGVYGLAGNSSDMCIDPLNPDNMVTKGGAWSHHASFVQLANQRSFPLDARLETAGFRLIRQL